MTQQLVTHDRFEKRWNLALAANDLPPVEESGTPPEMTPDALGELVIVIAEKAYAKHLIERDERDRLCRCGQEIIEIIGVVPTDGLARILGELTAD
ncbi:MAG: hypothetical protein AAGF58_15430 [Pseudomonadota bacterium]